MNAHSNITEGEPVPATRPLKLQLLDIADKINAAADFAEALDMATMAISDTRQRNALATVCDGLIDRMDELKALIESAREAA